MKLWETYFRLWQKFGDSLNEETKQSLSKEKDFLGDDRITDYYGFSCNKETCIESGV